ncbi:MAG: 2-oxoacid:acceptor oxidoreductase subunit alpha [Pseudomonadales bacterium]|jgi:2-oxoglutarate ferredoxin oxidoreductase subunit alpha|nr:2-oxoacid:acceptor oxidoreductase subunit alpha [Pseudomonadales bacterium]MDP7313805.1 2-oxoacid:acceptor oxidoreductase subunit alpha [Pseudomonadales bacterium]|tara:strand:- start:1655 stop:3514 length:1860 start_codon:yes stop_codon:yes gene_type:complete
MSVVEENPVNKMTAVVVRFAGDSGDGMQLTGNNFTEATAIYGNDLATFPDFPAEIRAPAGATFGVSAFQIYFGSEDVTTAGDDVDVLVAMNPAALITNLKELVPGGLIIADSDAFTDKNLARAGYAENPLEDGSLDAYRLIAIDVTKRVIDTVKPYGLTHKFAVRCKNMWTLGLTMWLFDRSRDVAIEGLRTKFTRSPEIAEANIAAINAGHAYGETAELPTGVEVYKIPRVTAKPGLYRNTTGTEALAYGILAGGLLSELPIVFASYPITPASGLLHSLAQQKQFEVITLQAEDEIAAVCSAIGASFAGSLGVTSSSGPGISLKAEAISLAFAAELPLLVVNTQRGGPSTGLPTKTEQSDLNQSIFGRHGDTILPVIAASDPVDCFDAAIEAIRIATRYRTPVILLSDGYIANASEPWHVPDFDSYEPFPVRFTEETEGFSPAKRDPKTLARVWAKPGTPGLEHRIGGIEKDYETGEISYDAENHQKMTEIRKAKIDGISNDIPKQEVALGNDYGDLAVVGWGSTFGAIHQGVKRSRMDGLDVSHIHIRHMWPLPGNLGELLSGYKVVLIPEMNTGQLVDIIRSRYLIDAQSLTKISGQPFKIKEIDAAIRAQLGNIK